MDIAKLYELQKIDTNMLKVRRRVAQIRQQQGESDELKATRAAATATQAEQEHNLILWSIRAWCWDPRRCWSRTTAA